MSSKLEMEPSSSGGEVVRTRSGARRIKVAPSTIVKTLVGESNPPEPSVQTDAVEKAAEAILGGEPAKELDESKTQIKSEENVADKDLSPEELDKKDTATDVEEDDDEDIDDEEEDDDDEEVKSAKDGETGNGSSNLKPVKDLKLSVALNGQEPTIRNLIMAAIAVMKNRKARPDTKRICNWIHRRYGNPLNSISEELERLVQVGELARVDYKGSASFRIVNPNGKAKRKRRAPNKPPAPQQGLAHNALIPQRTFPQTDPGKYRKFRTINRT